MTVEVDRQMLPLTFVLDDGAEAPFDSPMALFLPALEVHTCHSSPKKTWNPNTILLPPERFLLLPPSSFLPFFLPSFLPSFPASPREAAAKSPWEPRTQCSGASTLGNGWGLANPTVSSFA